MNRRNALRLTTTLLGGVIIGSEVFLSGCRNPKTNATLFSQKDIQLLDEIGETILPETPDSPGARAARIGDFMKTIVLECYKEKEQQLFLDGLHTLQSRVRQDYDADFVDLPEIKRLAFLSELGREAREQNEDTPHYFRMIKELTIWGYFTSEPGATQALRYNPVPGRYEGCVPYEEGDKAWAS